jgi:Type I phosphodiesterase / nucleotide pyrophosphatase
MTKPLRFSDLPRPDYNGGSIVNLMSSLIQSRGGRSPHRMLRGLSAAQIKPYKKVVLLLLDGLGTNQLHDYVLAGNGKKFLALQPFQKITTACPATTAAVVTTLATGASPTEHGFLGWHLHLNDLGMDGTILPFITRTGTPIAPPEFDLKKYLELPSPIATMRGRRVLISQGHIPTSRTSMAQPWWTERHSFEQLDGMVRQLRTFARSPKRGFAYAYWPTYDSLCHQYGPKGRVPAAHLTEIDASLARVQRALAGTDTLLLITADHGHMQTDTAINLSEIPGFYDTLASLPSGDSRMAQCFVRPARVREFLQMTRTAPFLGNCACVPHAEVLRSGILGPGTPHPALRNRLGDYVLFAAPGVAFLYPPALSKFKKAMKGNHGGLSSDELDVPLFVIHP